MSIYKICIYISSISFLAYGVSYFFTPHMKNEFKRFKLERFAFLTIVLEILGAIGLIVGLFYNPILILASGGLTTLMFLGVLVRVRIKDGLLVTLPAIFYMFLNLYIFYTAVGF